MRRVSVFFVMFCVFCYCLAGCGDEGGSSSGGGSTSSDSGSSSGGGQAEHPATPGGITGGAGGIGGLGHNTGATGQAQASGDFAITGVARESLAPDASHFPEAEGMPVVRNHGPNDEPAERDITFLGKFPSTNKADYKAHVKVDDQPQRNRDLDITSVAADKIVIHFPLASDLNNQPGLLGKMTVQVRYAGKILSIRIYIP